MEDLVEDIARGNVTEVKVVLASIVLALAVYQVAMMAVGYGKVRLPFLGPRAASFAHRTVGDAVVVITLVVAFMCIAYFGFEDGDDGDELRVLIHVIAGSLLLLVLALKIVVVRWWHGVGRYLPVLGGTVFGLYVAVWLSSAADYLWGG